jgi:hypothetical protein
VDDFGYLAALAIIGTGFVLVFLHLTRNLWPWADDNRQPVETTLARVVAKRTHVSGTSSGSTWTSYYCTFELSDGSREEFKVSGEQYGVLAEGDEGQLIHQGTRYQGFRRG